MIWLHLVCFCPHYKFNLVNCWSQSRVFRLWCLYLCSVSGAQDSPAHSRGLVNTYWIIQPSMLPFMVPSLCDWIYVWNNQSRWRNWGLVWETDLPKWRTWGLERGAKGDGPGEEARDTPLPGQVEGSVTQCQLCRKARGDNGKSSCAEN